MTITNDTARLIDLVRYMRAELHRAELISDQEYADLVKVDGSPARLETYDALRAERDALRLLLNSAYPYVIRRIKGEDWDIDAKETLAGKIRRAVPLSTPEAPHAAGFGALLTPDVVQAVVPLLLGACLIVAAVLTGFGQATLGLASGRRSRRQSETVAASEVECSGLRATQLAAAPGPIPTDR